MFARRFKEEQAKDYKSLACNPDWLRQVGSIISINGGDFRSFGNGRPLSLKRMKLRKSFTPKY